MKKHYFFQFFSFPQRFHWLYPGLMNKSNSIAEMSFDFALSIIELYKKQVEQKEFVLSKQLLRCGTSIGANVEEAGAGITKKDFINKMSIAARSKRNALLATLVPKIPIL